MTAAPVRIDAGGMADLPDVMIVMGDAFDPAFGEAWTEAQCAGVLGMPGSWLLIARTPDDVPAGFALLRSVAGEAELLLIAVARQFRRGGVGAALMARVKADAAAQGLTLLHLEVRDGNPALALYHAAGFEQVGRRRDYYRGRMGQVFDALTLSRNLVPD